MRVSSIFLHQLCVQQLHRISFNMKAQLDFIFWVVLLCLWIPARSQISENSADLGTIKPIKYILHLNWNPANEDQNIYFKADVRIVFQCIQPTENIVLNAKNLKIDESRVSITAYSLPFEKLKITNKHLDEKDLYSIQLSTSLEEDKIYEVRISYHKSSDHKNDSFFVNHSRSNEGFSRMWAVTKPGATNAQKILPCFDGNTKTLFELCILHSTDIASISNMSNVKEPMFNLVQDVYEESLLMSTSSFGFVIGNLKSKDFVERLSKTTIRIWSDENVIDLMNEAGEIALEVFLFYNKFLEVEYGLKQLQIVALSDYDGIDKYRYGLITLGESILKKSPVGTPRTSILLNLSNALINQWIGLQTIMLQWDERWLLAGLALYYQFRCFETLYSNEEFKIYGQKEEDGHENAYIVESFARVLDMSAEKSYPISAPVDSLDLNTIFSDNYAAEKGYHLVRTMNRLLGNHEFENVFKTYLQAHQFKSAKLEDLWDIFDSADEYRISIKIIMNSWITEKGYPHVFLSRDPNNKQITFKQERFKLLGDEDINDDDVYWAIPLSITTKSKANFKPWLSYKESTFPLSENITEDNWIVYSGNMNVLGRFQYEFDNYKALQLTLFDKEQCSQIPPIARAQLISDMLVFSENKKLEYDLTLDTLQYLKHEKSHLALAAAIRELNKIHLRLRHTDHLEPFKSYVKDILEPLFETDPYAHFDEKLDDDAGSLQNSKKLIIFSACSYGVDGCVKQCAKLVKDWTRNLTWGSDAEMTINSIPEPVRDIAYCQTIKHGESREWDYLLKRFSEEKDPSDKKHIFEALSCPNDAKLLTLYLKWWVEDYETFPQGYETAFFKALDNEIGYPIVYSVFLERIAKIRQNHKNNHSIFLSYFMKLIEMSASHDNLNMLNQLAKKEFSRRPDWGKIKLALEDVSRKALRNILWLDAHENVFNKETGYFKPKSE